MNNSSPPHHFLCNLTDIENGHCKEFALNNIYEDQTLELFIVRINDHIYAWKNKCPHTGVTLNWQADKFLDHSNTYIQCANHDALFNIDNGLCVNGPCAGESLQALRVTTNNHSIFLINE